MEAKKKDRAAILKSKREAEKRRQEKIKKNPLLLEDEKKKNHKKYFNRKKKGQVKMISQMNEREKRQKRKQWKKNSQAYREKEIERKSPPFGGNVAQSPVTNNYLSTFSNACSTGSTNQFDRTSSCNKCSRQAMGRKKVRKDRSAAYKKIKQLEKQLKKSNARAEMYKKRAFREVNRNQHSSKKNVTPRTKVQRLLHKSYVLPEVRKRLLFGEVITAELKNSYSELKKKHQSKKLFHSVVSWKLLKKYRLLKECKPFLRYREVKQKSSDPRAKFNKLADVVKTFLEQDSSSRLSPGKRDTITRIGLKKQKRLRNYSLRTLHQIFIKESKYTISYSLFCRLCPFWIVKPNVVDRDTCLCSTHANMTFLVEKLHSMGKISHKSPYNIINELCCDSGNIKCMMRSCNTCKHKVVGYIQDCEIDDTVNFKQWQTKAEKRLCKGKEITVKITQKVTLATTQGEMLKIFEKQILKFMNHIANIHHQYKTIHSTKENLTESEVLVHVDFSENYNCKYAEEIQSVHFGASRAQVTLHTGVYYYVDTGTQKTQSHAFCTLSDSLRHDPSAVWDLLRPILRDIAEKFPLITKVHFLSDSPSMQYRNKTMFYMIPSFMRIVMPQVKEINWNYSEAGHCKGAPDGIGAVCKRTADNLIAQGKDIPNFETLVPLLVKNCPGIQVLTITPEMITDVDDFQKELDPQPFKGTMMVHQVSWNAQKNNLLSMRTLSCVECKSGEHCHHFGIGGKLWSINTPSHNEPTLAIQSADTNEMPITGSDTGLYDLQCNVSQFYLIADIFTVLICLHCFQALPFAKWEIGWSSTILIHCIQEKLP